MPLNLTRVAYGCASLSELEIRIASRAAETGPGQPIGLTTRYKPKRWEEMAGGSLYWIIAHQIVARSPLIGFGEAPGYGDGIARTDILVAPKIIVVRPQRKRSHQGWRYLDEKDAPADLSHDAHTQTLPAALVQELNELGLV